ALARAQRWLRTVPWGELRTWRATEPLPTILRTMPHHSPSDQRSAEEPASSVKLMTMVRSGEDFPLDDDTWVDEDFAEIYQAMRYNIQEGEDHIRDKA